MNFISKVQYGMSNPAMALGYARWLATTLISRHPPRVSLPGGAKIGEWISFSEYWSFQDIIPQPERLFVERCLASKSASGIGIDVGANVGAFTCMMASMGHTVHAFEPIPETFCRLKNNVKANGLLSRAHLNCLAVGTEQSLVTFQVTDHSPATNRIVSPNEALPTAVASTQTVATVSIDGYCAVRGIEFIDLLKIDVEGMEPFVLRGAKNLLDKRRIAAVLIEICPVNLRAVGLSAADLYREFEAARYSPYILNLDGRPGSQLSVHQIEAMNLANVAVLPNF